MPVGEIPLEETAKKLADAREDIKLAKTDAERIAAERNVARYEAMQAAATH